MLLNCDVREDSWESLGLQGDQSWVFTGRTDVKAETPVFWPPHAKSWLTWKDPDVGKDWRQKEKGMTEDEMAGWHHQFNGHGFGWTPGVGDGQGGLACCSLWGHKESDMNERLHWTEWGRGTAFCSSLQRNGLEIASKSGGKTGDTEERVNHGSASCCLG